MRRKSVRELEEKLDFVIGWAETQLDRDDDVLQSLYRMRSLVSMFIVEVQYPTSLVEVVK